MRRTLDNTNPIKLGDFDCCHDTVVITVLNAGQVCYIAHERITLLNASAGTQEGSPLTSTNGDGGGPIHRFRWKGELWAFGSVPQTGIDFES